MKKALLFLGLFAGITLAFSQSVKLQNGYYKPSTDTAPHYKTESNKTNTDNFSTQGNTNIYTQEKGTKARDYSSEAYNYGNGQNIQTGSKGGQYYINSNGNKTYVPKRN